MNYIPGAAFLSRVDDGGKHPHRSPIADAHTQAFRKSSRDRSGKSCKV